MNFWLKHIFIVLVSCCVVLGVNFLIKTLITRIDEKKSPKENTATTLLKVQLTQFITHIILLFSCFTFFFKSFYASIAVTVGVVIGLNVSLWITYQNAMKISE